MKYFFYPAFLSLFIATIVACKGPDTATDDTGVKKKRMQGYYTEAHRPQFHFSPEEQWMNDPNGMVYEDGEYHLFYQFYPDSNVWGPMHWGHAISEDMIYWQHLPIALYPDTLGYIFSGSAVADKENTSGFGSGSDYPLLAIYTYHDTAGERAGRENYQTQGIAYSLDKGRTWEKYEGNPVIPNPGIRDFRDPKVFWYDETGQWVMILAVADRVYIYNSPNLKEWELASEFGEDQGSHGGVWECPDLFELEVEGTGEKKWMMIVSLGDGNPNGGSGTQYFVGSFDGKTFVNENPAEKVLWLEYGTDNYAGVTWSGIPEEDGRRLFIGWMSNWKYATKVPTYAWRSAMTIPRVLSFIEINGETRLKTTPVQEIETLRDGSHVMSLSGLDGDMHASAAMGIENSLLEVVLETEPGKANKLGVELSNSKGENIKIGLDVKKNEFFIDRTNAGKKDFKEGFAKIHLAPRMIDNNKVKMHLYIDVASIELFADEGLTVMTDIFFPNEDFDQLKFFSEGGILGNSTAVIYELNRTW